MAENKRQVGDWIAGRYEIFDIHAGGMGVVYVVYDHQGASGHRVLALKTLRHEFLQDTRQVERFVRECHTWIKLERHRHIVQAYTVQVLDDKPHAVLELVTGGDLRRWIGTSRLDLPQVLRFGVQFCLGMEHAIQKGLQCHRDIKPENLLITEGGTLKITDFGLAKVRDEEVSAGPGDPIPLADALETGATFTPEGQTWNHPEPPAPSPRAPENGAAGAIDVTQDHSSALPAASLTMPGMIPVDGPSNPLETMDWKKPAATPPDAPGGDPPTDMTVGWASPPPPPGSTPVWEGTQAGAMLGTAVYMPPEQFRNAKVVNYRADIYSFGVVLFEMLTTKPPFRGNTVAKLDREHTKVEPPSVVPYIPARSAKYAKEVDRIVQRCLMKDPAKRYTTFSELRVALSTALWHVAREKVSVPAASEMEAWELTGKGVSLGTLSRFAEERDSYEASIRVKPQHVPAWFNQAAALGALGRPDEAVEYANLALHLNPRSVPALINKGLALHALQRDDEAIACFDTAAHVQPRDPDVWYGRASVLQDQQNFEGARVALEQARRLRPAAGAATVPWVRRLEDTPIETPQK